MTRCSRDAVLLAFRAGSLVVAAAGNDGIEGSPREYPAAYPHVLTVGATTESGRVAVFSTLGPFVDLAAPGARIDVAEPLSNENQTGYDDASGTSFSAPMVAGAAAWVWTTRPAIDNTQLFEIMRLSAVDFGASGFDAASGYGLLNIPRALGFRTPPRDPQEPNEDPDQIEPHGLFASGTSPMTSPAHPAGTISARVDRNEDPVDLYRVWVPPRRAIRASCTGSVALRLLRPGTEGEAAACAREREARRRRLPEPRGAKAATSTSRSARDRADDRVQRAPHGRSTVAAVHSTRARPGAPRACAHGRGLARRGNGRRSRPRPAAASASSRLKACASEISFTSLATAS